MHIGIVTAIIGRIKRSAVSIKTLNSSSHEPHAAERGLLGLKRVGYASPPALCAFPYTAERHVENPGVKNLVTTFEVEVAVSNQQTEFHFLETSK